MGPAVSSPEITRLLKAWSNGDANALEQLTPFVYSELHRLASLYMTGERENHILQPSALVNEAYIRLLAGQPVDWASRRHFFAASSRLMRQILIDIARSLETAKRGNRSPHLTVSGIDQAVSTEPALHDFLDLDAALTSLAQLNLRQAHIVELRYFGGLELAEVAAVLNVSERTVSREWLIARAWLFDVLQPRKP